MIWGSPWAAARGSIRKFHRCWFLSPKISGDIYASMLWLHYCFASAFFRQVGFVKSLNSNPAEQITHYSTGPNWIQLHFSKLVQAVYALHACVSAHGDMNEVTTVVFCHKSHDTWIALSFDYVPARAPREGATSSSASASATASSSSGGSAGNPWVASASPNLRS